MFGYGIDRKTLYIILGVLALISFLGMNRIEMLSMILTFPAVIIAITFHEFAHAWMADKLGDTTPRSQGRLTLNPTSHLDPVGFVLLMFAHIGWGKPVQINPNNFTSNKSKGMCEALVSLAGPVMNFIIAIVLSFVYVIIDINNYNFYDTSIGSIVDILLQVTIVVNIGLGVFNLIPLPPLDGEKIFRQILPYRVQEWLDTNYNTIHFIFMILWITGLLGTIVSPVIMIVQKGIWWFVGQVVGLFL